MTREAKGVFWFTTYTDHTKKLAFLYDLAAVWPEAKTLARPSRPGRPRAIFANCWCAEGTEKAGECEYVRCC